MRLLFDEQLSDRLPALLAEVRRENGLQLFAEQDEATFLALG